MHFVWTTKNREPYFSKKGRKRLFPYIQKIVESQKAELVAIGGVEDHVHILVRMHRLDEIYKLIRNIKSRSSSFIKKANKRCELFAWQNGYGIFAVSASLVNRMRKYVLNQEEHHKKMSFDDEMEMLSKS
jgi:REP element-mobilizing transposase RayT